MCGESRRSKLRIHKLASFGFRAPKRGVDMFELCRCLSDRQRKNVSVPSGMIAALSTTDDSVVVTIAS